MNKAIQKMLLTEKYKYHRKIKRLFNTSIIAYYPLWEKNGTIVYDISGHGFNGSHNGVILGLPGIGDGNSCPLYDGIDDYSNIYSTNLAIAFNGNLGTIILWGKVNSGVWTDGLNRHIFSLVNNAENYITLWKFSDNHLYCTYKAGGITKQTYIFPQPNVFFTLAITWNKTEDRVKGFLNGIQYSGDQTGLGVWTGTPTAIKIGAYWGNWSGLIAHVVILNSEATQIQLSQASEL